jgi:hypothetical protein
MFDNKMNGFVSKQRMHLKYRSGPKSQIVADSGISSRNLGILDKIGMRKRPKKEQCM